METTTNKLCLEKWITSFFEDLHYQHLIKRFIHSPNWITNPTETAMLYALIQKIKPQITLEIGSFFCETTQIMAQALRDNNIEGKIITLDPFGEERVPNILGSWSSELKSLVDYRPLNSMQYFQELETLRYYAVPYDFHITGKGVTRCNFQKSIDIYERTVPIELFCNPELSCGTGRSDVNICYEIELRYQSDFSNQAYMLLNADQPITFA